MDLNFGGSAGPATLDYDTDSLRLPQSSTDSGYRTMDTMPSERKRMSARYVTTSPDQTTARLDRGGPEKTPFSGRPVIQVTSPRDYSLSGIPSSRREKERRLRKVQDHKKTVADADTLSPKEKRISSSWKSSPCKKSQRNPVMRNHLT
jgi:hypothetical protein